MVIEQSRSLSEIPRLWGYRQKFLPGITLHDGIKHDIPYYERIADAPGPVFIISAGMHPGPETGAIASVNEGALALTRFPIRKGNILVVPHSNYFGMLAGTHDFPYGQSGDLNRCFPGNPNGTIAEIMSHNYYSFMKRRIQENDQKVGKNNLPSVWLDFHNEDMSQAYVRKDRIVNPSINGMGKSHTDELADATGITVVNEYPLDIYQERKLDHSVTGAVTNDPECSAVAMTIELGESDFTNEENVGVGVRCIIRMAVKLGIIDEKDVPPEILGPESSRIATSSDNLSLVPITELYDEKLTSKRITTPGYPVLSVKPNQKVNKGNRLGYFVSPSALSSLKQDLIYFVSPYNGYVISLPTQGDYVPGNDLITMAVKEDSLGLS